MDAQLVMITLNMILFLKYALELVEDVKGRTCELPLQIKAVRVFSCNDKYYKPILHSNVYSLDTSSVVHTSNYSQSKF